MAKETVTEPSDPEKQRRLADELLKEFENLPAEVRRSIAVHATAPNVLEHVAGGIQQTLDDLVGDAPANALRHAATLMRSHVAHAHRVLLDTQAFAGKLEGLAWARDAHEAADDFSQRD